jgi:serine phosphatase RsbU (regulator of sigma subunit)
VGLDPICGRRRSPAGEEYGRWRLANIVRSSCSVSAQGIIDAIFAGLDRFNPVLFDDQTLVVMKVK